MEELTKQDLIDLQESYTESKAIERRALMNITDKEIEDAAVKSRNADTLKSAINYNRLKLNIKQKS